MYILDGNFGGDMHQQHQHQQPPPPVEWGNWNNWSGPGWGGPQGNEAPQVCAISYTPLYTCFVRKEQ